MVCNSGVSLTPIIDGRTLHFGHRGLFNGLSILGDEETGSYWDHVTGRCLHGPLAGRALEVSPLMHLSAEQAARRYPHAKLALSRPNLFGRWMGRLAELTRLSRRGFLPPGFRGTMGRVDPRREPMELGLGVWNDRARRFYPLDLIRTSGGALVDTLGGVRVVIYSDPATAIPAAACINAETATLDGGDLLINCGPRLREGRLHHPDGRVEIPAHPMQLFTRWYGFSFTFPKCEIAEAKSA